MQQRQNVTSVKENVESNNFAHKASKKKNWDYVKIQNLKLIHLEEGQDSQLKEQEIIFAKFTENKFPNLTKDLPIKV